MDYLWNFYIITQWMDRVQSKWKGRHVNFAWKQLRSYLDECKKNEIHVLYLYFIFHIFYFCSLTVSLVNNAEKNAINQRVCSLLFHDVTSIERSVVKSTFSVTMLTWNVTRAIVVHRYVNLAGPESSIYSKAYSSMTCKCVVYFAI